MSFSSSLCRNLLLLFVTLSCGPSGRGQSSTVFSWKNPASGDFTSASNWDVNDAALQQNPTDPLDQTARVSPRAGDAVTFREGAYTVNLAGAPALSRATFEQRTVPGPDPVFDVTLKLSAAFDVGEMIMTGFGKITIDGGNFKASRLSKSGVQLVIHNAQAEFAEIVRGIGSLPTDLRREVIVTGAGRFITTGPVNLHGVTVESGAVWEHAGPADSFGTAPFSSAVPTITLTGSGRFEAPALDVRSTAMLVSEGGGVFQINDFRSGNAIQLSNGSRMVNESARIVGAGDRHVIAGTGTEWRVAGAITVTENAFIDVKDGATFVADSLLIPEHDAGGHVKATGAGAKITIQKPVEIISGAVDVENGAAAAAPSLAIRTNGSVNVAGANAVWNVADTVVNEGQIVIGPGGLIKSRNVQVGAANPGSVRIVGPDGAFRIDDRLDVGGLNGGPGTINISDAGVVSAPAIVISRAAGISSMTIQGAGSSLTADDELVVGMAGDGRLFLVAGAHAVFGSPSGNPPPGNIPPEETVESSCVPSPVGGADEPKAIIGAEAGSIGFVSVTGADAQFDVHGQLVIGQDGVAGRLAQGTMLLRSGGVARVHGSRVTLGLGANSQGGIVLDGLGAQLKGIRESQTGSGAVLEIGRFGRGYIDVRNGAAIQLPSTILGCFERSSGTIRVVGRAPDNTPAKFTSDGSITIGSHATGFLDIQTGGEAHSLGRAVLGRFGRENGRGSGVVSLRGRDARWNHNSDGADPGDVVVGEHGDGRLLILEGAQFSSHGFIVAQEAGSRGTVTLSDPGTQLSVSSNLIVGYRGTSRDEVAEGVLIITNGATLTARGEFVTLGQEQFGKGTLILDGAESVLSGIKSANNGAGAVLEIARHGEGMLVLTNGAAVMLPSIILATEPGSKAVVSIATNSVLESDGSITVGGAATGRVEVVTGGELKTSHDAVLGRNPAAEGVVTLSGKNARWKHEFRQNLDAPGEIVAGQFGRGRLIVRDSAEFDAGEIAPGGKMPNLTLGKEKQSEGTIELTGPGSRLNWPGTIRAGDVGLGRIVIRGDAGPETSLSTKTLELGLGDTGFGDVTVQGRQARLNLQHLNLGARTVVDLENDPAAGSGLLSIRDGGTVNVMSPQSDKIAIAGRSGFGLPSEIIVDGGKLIAPNSILELQLPGESRLEIRNGGHVRSGAMIVGGAGGPGAAGGAFVHLEGASGSQFSRLELIGVAGAEERLVIGNTAPGQVKVSSHSSIELSFGRGGIRVGVDHPGLLEVNGPGALLISELHDLHVGSPNQIGTLIVTNNGDVRVRRLNVERQRSTVLIDNNGHLRAGEQITVQNHARIDVRQGFLRVSGFDSPIPGTVRFTGKGAGSALGQMFIARTGGILTAATAVSLFIARIEVDEQSSIDIAAGNLLPEPGAVRVFAQGQLSGVGVIRAREVQVIRDGIIHVLPGPIIPVVIVPLNRRAVNSPMEARGSLTIEGNFNQMAGSTLMIDVGGPRPILDYGVLDVTGAARIAGKLVLNFVNAFAPKSGDRFDLVDSAADFQEDFENVSIQGLAPGFQYEMAANGAGGLSLVARSDGVATSAPALSIELSQAGFEILWPAWALDFTLQSATDLARPAWSDRFAPGNRLTISPLGASEFFRLIRKREAP